MGIQVALNHRTEYRYDKAVYLGPQVIQLRPAPHGRTPILSYSLSVIPAQHILKWQLDPHSNYLARVLFQEKTTEFAVEVNLVADLAPVNPFDFFLEPEVVDYPFTYAADLRGDLEPYLAMEMAGQRLRSFVAELPGERRGTIGFLADLNRRISAEIGYTTRMEHGVQTCEETLEKRLGSCRDSAWLLVQVLRQVGIAARFVSGYLIQLAGAVGGDGPAKESAELHAWAEAYLPGAGWIGMDATSGMFATEGHIPLVCTPSASKAAPNGGTVEPAGVEFSYSMTVVRLNEEPRLERPFGDEDWAKVEIVATARDEASTRAVKRRIFIG